MYEIKTGKNSNFYEKLYEKREILDNFDFSNYPSDHFLYNVENKLTVLKFKDEFPGDIITEFVALKPKLYSILSQSKYISFNNTGSKLFKQRFLFSKIKKIRKNFLKNFEKKMSKKFRWKKNLVKKNFALKKKFGKEKFYEKKNLSSKKNLEKIEKKKFF